MLDGKVVLTGAWMFYSDEQRRFQPTYYYIGHEHDGKFETEKKELYDFAGNFYAVQSFVHEGRQIAIGWVADFYNEHLWEKNGAHGSMALPRELHVKDGILYQHPIEEVGKLRGKCYLSIGGQNITLRHLNRNAYYAKIVFQQNTDFEILLGQKEDARITLVREGAEVRLVTQGVKSHYVNCMTQVENLEKLEIYVDHRLVEVFLNDGEKAGAKLFYQEEDGIFEAEFDTEEHVESIEIYEMKGIWG